MGVSQQSIKQKRFQMKKILIATAALLFIGCGEQPKENDTGEDAALSAAASQLKTLEEEFIPESISDDGSLQTSSASGNLSKGSPDSDDICKDLDFIECQPRLIRAYLRYGRLSVAMTYKIVKDVALALKDTPNNSSGRVTLEDENLVIEFQKTSFKKFQFLVISGIEPVGYVSADNGSYHIQFNISALEKDDMNSKGGKIDIQVNYTDRKNWESQLAINDVLCDTFDPASPEAVSIGVQRQQGIWKGQTLLYSGIAAAPEADKSCDLAPSDENGVAIYTEFVANRSVAKAGMYLMKRTKADVSDIQNFGINSYCTNYPDNCLKMAHDLGTTQEDLTAYLNTFVNPYCMRRGSKNVTFNDDCSDVSADVANASYLPNASWMTPLDFYQMTIELPTGL